MAIEKRGSIWHVNFMVDGQTIRRSTGKTVKKEAQKQHDEWKAMGSGIFMLFDKAKDNTNNRTWNEATERWLLEKRGKASINDDHSKVEWIASRMNNKPLKDVTSKVIKEIANLKLQEGVANGTVNRHIALMVSIMKRSTHEWEWTTHSVKVPLFAEAKKNIRWVTSSEAKSLIDALPDHLKDVVTFGLATGMRRANILNLKWDQVDLNRKVVFISGAEMKAGKSIGLPLNDMAVSVITRHLDNGSLHIFLHNDKPFKSISHKTWTNAVKKAGLSAFRFHDLRHTFASWLIQSGVSTAELQELGGWQSPAMVQRYAHLSPEKLMESSQKVAKIFNML